LGKSNLSQYKLKTGQILIVRDFAISRVSSGLTEGIARLVRGSLDDQRGVPTTIDGL
jgi:hypothetical protein